MPRTQDELVERTLSKIGIVDALEPVSAEDGALVKKIYADVLEYLRDEGLVYWDADSIPNAVFLPLIEIMAAHTMPDFGIDDISKQSAYEQSGLQRLKRHMAKERSAEAVRSFYY